MNRRFVLPLSALVFGSAACDGAAGIDENDDGDSDSTVEFDSGTDTDVVDVESIIGTWDGTRVQFDEYDIALPIEYTYGSGEDAYTSVQTFGVGVTPQMASIVQTQVYTDSNGDVIEDRSSEIAYSGQWSITGERTYLLSFSLDGDTFDLSCTVEPVDEMVCTTPMEGSVITYTFERNTE